MNGSEMLEIGLLIFSVGGVFGVSATLMVRDELRQAEVARHEEVEIIQGKELARLRAQVADIIGKEKT